VNEMKTPALLLAGIAALFLATGTAHAADAIDVCDQRFQARELHEIGACYAKATNSKCDGSLDGARAQACSDWVDTLAWSTDCRHSRITKRFTEQVMQGRDAPVNIFEESSIVTISYNELRKLLKDLPRITRALKASDAYHKCLIDRDIKGKVKHCYGNDRRWREFITGAW
jgi:hypothetical protein